MASRGPLEVRDLKRLTEKYWRRLVANSKYRLPVWRQYVRELLPLEMQGKAADDSIRTLVLLVGHSIEPLMQSAWWYQPAHVLLLVNEQYGETLSGQAFAIQIIDLLSSLPEDHHIGSDAVETEVVSAEPDAVFRALVRYVGQESDTVIDITGAKKSMVAGAFLYAAYAGVPVSYVDFDEASFSTESNRPYGFASQIKLLDNPYSTFSLRDWERVQQLYEGHHFQEAGRLLSTEIAPLMDGDYFIDPDTKENKPLAAVRLMHRLLRCYERWDEGDFAGAHRLTQQLRAEGIEFAPPTAVATLHVVWPSASDDCSANEAAGQLIDRHQRLSAGRSVDGTADCRDSFFCRDDLLLVYADDELARIKRLIDPNEDYRSALLRAASLNEVLLKARLANLCCRGKLVLRDGSIVDFENLIERATAIPMLVTLRGGVDKYVGEMVSDVARLRAFWRDCPLNIYVATKLRDRTVHTYLPVPPKVAEAVRLLAERNLEDYRDNWSDGPHVHTVAVAMPWSELCSLCGADAFLPPNILD